MPVELERIADGRVVHVRVSDKLTKEDYEYFVPEVERLVAEHGKIRVLVEARDFHGWEAGTLWEDIKFDVKHFNSIDRLAIVGEKKWQKGMAVFCKPFTTAEVRYYPTEQLDEAREWVASETESGAPVR